MDLSHRRVLAATAALVLLGLAGCSSGGSDDAGSSDNLTQTEAAGAVAAPSPAAGRGAGGSSTTGGAGADSSSLEYAADAPAGVPADSLAAGAAPSNRPAALEPTDPRSLVKKGNVSYTSDDVAQAHFQVLKIVQKRGGEVAEDSTESDDKGVTESSLMTLRVPVDAFDATMGDLQSSDLQGVKVTDASTSSTDVSDQVIDTGVRVEVQKRSIERISVLLDRATNIRDIVNIERELSNREAQLGSLEKRQDFLADQTSLSTITISIERPAEKKAVTAKKKEKKHETGFVGGLHHGWHAFGRGTEAVLTVIGAVLPFAIVAGLLASPWFWLRRRKPAPAVQLP